MSKSKGNTVDPLGLIDRYGAGALRFFMAVMESQGRDNKMDEKRVEGERNFATKRWNAAPFGQVNGERKGDVEGKRVEDRVDFGGRRVYKKQKRKREEE